MVLLILSEALLFIILQLTSLTRENDHRERSGFGQDRLLLQWYPFLPVLS